MGEFKFQFEESARRQLATPRWMRPGAVLVFCLTLLVVSMFFGERIKDGFYAHRLEGRWLGEEEEPGGLWVREVEYFFHSKGSVDITLRLLPQGSTQPEVSSASQTWNIKHGHLIIDSPLTGPVPVRLLHVGRKEIRFGGGAKIKSFRKVEEGK